MKKTTLILMLAIFAIALTGCRMYYDPLYSGRVEVAATTPVYYPTYTPVRVYPTYYYDYSPVYTYPSVRYYPTTRYYPYPSTRPTQRTYYPSTRSTSSPRTDRVYTPESSVRPRTTGDRSYYPR